MKPNSDHISINANAGYIGTVDPFGLRQIWTAPWSDVCRSVWIYGAKLEDDQWIFSADLINRPVSERTMNFLLDFPAHLSDQEIRDIKRRLKRFALLYGLITIDSYSSFARARLASRSARKLLSPRSWISNFRSVLRLAQDALQTYGLGQARSKDSCPDGPTLFAHLSRPQMQELVDRGHSMIVNSYGRIELQHAAGFIDDWVSGVEVPKRKNGRQNKTQPNSDSDLSRILSTSLVLSGASEVIAIAFSDYRADVTMKLGKAKHLTRLNRWLLSASVLQENLGSVGDTGYFDSDGKLQLLDPRGRSRIPRYLGSLLRAAQMGNAVLIAFGCGLRPQELDNLKRECDFQKDGLTYFAGSAFKGDGTGAGVPRHWPLPDLAAQAMRQQKRLAEIVEPNKDGLWIDRLKLEGTANFMTMSNRVGQNFCDLTDPQGEPLANIDAVNIYRIRTAAARLVALSIKGGTMAATVTLGHKNIAQTVGYYNARGDWDVEFAELISEVDEALGAEIIKEFHDGTAPPKLEEFIEPILTAVDQDSQTPRNGEEVTGETSVANARRAIGSSFRFVRRGVLCSARGMELGRCSNRRGIQDFTNCKSDCLWRFETAAVAEDLRQVVETYLEQWSGVDKNEALLVSEALEALLDAFDGRDWLMQEFRDKPLYLKFIDDLTKPHIASISTRVKQFELKVRGDS